MKPTALILGILLLLVLLIPACLFLKTCNTASNMVDNGFKTIEQQFSPSELLKKYEWFKDASAQCDQKIATLYIYESRFINLKISYGVDSLKRKNWSRSDMEQWNIWQSEYLGIKASYNELAAQYNAQMAKFNYAFCNAGELPKGAEYPLPKEYKPYLNE